MKIVIYLDISFIYMDSNKNKHKYRADINKNIHFK